MKVEKPPSNCRFICIDGPVGAGKTTLIELLKKNQTGFKFTREPGGTEIGKVFRKMILESRPPLSPWTELFLVLADRVEHLEILKQIRDEIVICDRYIYSTIAYFGAGKGLGEDFVNHLCRKIVGPIIPDLIILLDVDPNKGRERKLAQGPLDNLDGMPLEFHHLARDSFLRQADQAPEPFIVINTTEISLEIAYNLVKTIIVKATNK